MVTRTSNYRIWIVQINVSYPHWFLLIRIQAKISLLIRIQIVQKNVKGLLEIQIDNNQDYTLYCIFSTYLASYAISFCQVSIFVTIRLKKSLGFWLSVQLVRSWIRINFFYADPDQRRKSHFLDPCGSGSETLIQIFLPKIGDLPVQYCLALFSKVRYLHMDCDACLLY